MKSVALSQGDTLTRDLLPSPMCDSLTTTPIGRPVKPLERWSLEEMEQAHIKRVLDAAGWHKGQACEILGISRPRLRRMIRQYGLASPDSVVQEMDDEEESER